MLNTEVGVGCGSVSSACGGSGDCPAPPDLCIKRHDTRPSLRISVSDCDGPTDLTEEGIIVEASMWFEAKLKSELTSSATELKFADNLGFQSVSAGDVISFYKSRSPEKMLVASVNEVDKTVQVVRAHGGTSARAWPKGAELAVFRFSDQPAQLESVFEESESLDGVVEESLVDTLLRFDWNPEHTAVPGCYWFEFKILKLSHGVSSSSVDWVKRIPLSSNGFMVRIVDSPTSPS